MSSRQELIKILAGMGSHKEELTKLLHGISVGGANQNIGFNLMGKK